MQKICPFLVAVVLGLTTASANITLPPLISDNMLLQCPQAALWGRADPSESITVEFGGIVAKTTADKEGRWRVKLDGLKPGSTGSIIFSGKNMLTIQNVAAGDVWVGSGQSNMVMNISKSKDCYYGGVLNEGQEIAAANFPDVRMFIVRNGGSETPVEDADGRGEVCTPDNLPHWSATGYFFSRQLHQDLGIPIGMVLAASGGSSCQAWTPTEVLQADPEFRDRYYAPRKGELAEYPQRKEKYDAWKASVETAKASGQPIPLQPERPEPPGGGCYSPSILFNGMLSGVIPYSIKGIIWYQGENNIGDSIGYRRLLPAMIASWRKALGQPELPFCIVQLASWRARHPDPTDSHIANLREAQGETSINGTAAGMAVAIDIGNEKNVHPANKQEVGRRLALIAEAKIYGKSLVCSGPSFDAAVFGKDGVTISYKPGTAPGLATKGGGPIKGFAIAGEDKKFVWADAKIIPGNSGAKEAESTLLLSSPQVAKPVAVRYAWADNPEVNLVNQAGLPAVPFRTDHWPQVAPLPPGLPSAIKTHPN